MTVEDNRGEGSFPKTQNQHDVIYVQPLKIDNYHANIKKKNLLLLSISENEKKRRRKNKKNINIYG